MSQATSPKVYHCAELQKTLQDLQSKRSKFMLFVNEPTSNIPETLKASEELAEEVRELKNQIENDSYDLKLRKKLAKELGVEFVSGFSAEGIALAGNFPSEVDMHALKITFAMVRYIKRDGSLLNNIIYNASQEMSEGLAPVQEHEDAEYSYVTAEGQDWGNGQFSKMPGSFKDGMAIIGDFQKTEIINKKNQKLQTFEDANVLYSEGYFMVRQRKKVSGKILSSYQDISGNKLSFDGKTEFVDVFGESIRPFNNGIGAILVNKEWFIVKKDGTKFLDQGFEHVGSFSSGIIAVREHGGDYYYLDAQGNKVMERMGTISDFHEGKYFTGNEIIYMNGKRKKIKLEGYGENELFSAVQKFHDGVLILYRDTLKPTRNIYAIIDYRGETYYIQKPQKKGKK